MSGPFFDRHRSDDPITDESGIGIRGPNGGRGIGSSDIGSDGARPFGGGRGTLIHISSLNIMQKIKLLHGYLADLHILILHRNPRI